MDRGLRPLALERALRGGAITRQLPHRRRSLIDPELPTTIDVTPRYLAGSDGTQTVLQPLTGQAGWLHHYNRDLDQDHVSSPDMRFRIGLNQLDPGAWWHIAAARAPLGPPQWQAGFAKDTPEELIAAVADQLRYAEGQIDWTGESHPALREGAANLQEAADLLLSAGWREYASANGVRLFGTADGLARAEIRTQADPFDLMGRCALAIEAGPADAGIPYWQALFTADTPALITTAFVRAVVDTAPLRRDAEAMDDHLLAHLGYHLDENGLVKPPPPYTEEDIRRVTAHVASGALDWADQHAEEIWEVCADRAIAGQGITFRQLPKEEAELAAALVVDLVMDAAHRTEALVGLPPTDTGPSWREPAAVEISTDLALTRLCFTNADLYAAATAACERQILWTEDRSAVTEAMDDERLHSSDTVLWKDLDPTTREQADQEVLDLCSTLAYQAHTLFTPQHQPNPAPLVAVAPLYLAGPGHSPAAAAAPLHAAGWSLVDRTAQASHYSSPCGRLHATAWTTPSGTAWSTSCHELLSGSERWRANIDMNTPPEITAAFHTALVTTLTASPTELFDQTAVPDTGLAPLADAGWFHDEVPGHIVWTEPDAAVASVTRTTDPGLLAAGASTNWVISGGSPETGSRAGWYAELSAHIPAPLLSAVTTALTSPEPVARLGRQVPAAHLPFLDITPLAGPAPLSACEPSTRPGATRARTAASTPAAVHRAAEAAPPGKRR